MTILDGKECAEYYYSHFPTEIKGKFHIITIGDDPASKVYVRNKIKACEKIGITPVHKVFTEDTSIKEIESYLDMVQIYEKDTLGVMVQLPIPDKYNSILKRILPMYDVDGFGQTNLQNICTNKEPWYYPATPKGIMMLLDYYNIDVEGKHVVIINRSDIVGRPLANMMLKKNATVTICHSHTKNLKEITKTADIIVTAVGQPKYLDSTYVADYSWDYYNDEEEVTTKHPIVIDVAMCRDENGKLCGDVDFESVKPFVSAITPVPGGVGPLTVCALMSNLEESYSNKKK